MLKIPTQSKVESNFYGTYVKRMRNNFFKYDVPCLYTNINLILPQGLVDLFHEEIPPETDIFNDYVFGIVACIFFIKILLMSFENINFQLI